MKYTEEVYLSCGYYAGSEGETHYQNEIRKAAKLHQCCYCGRDIIKGEQHYYEVCILEGEGWKSARTCLKHLDR